MDLVFAEWLSAERHFSFEERNCTDVLSSFSSVAFWLVSQHPFPNEAQEVLSLPMSPHMLHEGINQVLPVRKEDCVLCILTRSIISSQQTKTSLGVNHFKMWIVGADSLCSLHASPKFCGLTSELSKCSAHMKSPCVHRTYSRATRPMSTLPDARKFFVSSSCLLNVASQSGVIWNQVLLILSRKDAGMTTADFMVTHHFQHQPWLVANVDCWSVFFFQAKRICFSRFQVRRHWEAQISRIFEWFHVLPLVTSCVTSCNNGIFGERRIKTAF